MTTTMTTRRGGNGHDGDDDEGDLDAMAFGALDDDDDDGGRGGDDHDDDNGDDDDDDEARPLVDVQTGRFITADDAEGDAAYNRTTTRSKGYGATVQAIAATEVGAGENILTLGVSADLADVGFTFTSEVGTLTPDRTVAGSGLLAGIYGEAPDDLFNTGLDTANSAVGLYFSDTLSFTERTHLTVSGRFNHARIEIADRLGTSLDGEHAFSRFNVGTGLVHQFSDAVSVFGRYAESNRAPTAAELSCADPAEPCRVPNAFISDPPLEQAVARSVEGGLRGRAGDGSAWRLNWSVAVYRTAIADDILFVASPELIGTGYFQNAGDTRRIGLDAELNGQVRRLGWYAGYGLIEATFQSPLELPGDAEVNDAATEGGFVAVEPGDHMPGIPRHSFKAGLRYAVLDAWDVMLETVTASSRVFVGDEGNDQVRLAGYGIANLRSVYRAGEHLEVFARVDNLFDRRYGTFGALAELEVFLSEVPNASDPRFVLPGHPRAAPSPACACASERRPARAPRQVRGAARAAGDDRARGRRPPPRMSRERLLAGHSHTYPVFMKNITLSIDDTVLRTVRLYAAERGSTGKRAGPRVPHGPREPQDRTRKARRRIMELSARSAARIGSRSWTREELHERS